MARKRQRDAKAGLTAVTVTVPTDATDPVRELARRQCDGESAVHVARDWSRRNDLPTSYHSLFERVTEQTPPEAQDRASDAPERPSAPPSPLRHGTTPRPPLEPPRGALAPPTGSHPTQRPTALQKAPRRRFTAADLAARFTAKRVPPPELSTDGEGTNREEVLSLSRLHKEGP